MAEYKSPGFKFGRSGKVPIEEIMNVSLKPIPLVANRKRVTIIIEDESKRQEMTVEVTIGDYYTAAVGDAMSDAAIKAIEKLLRRMANMRNG